MAESALIYCMVARGKDTILAEYSGCSGNFTSYVPQVMRKLDISKLLSNYVLERYSFFVLAREGYVYLVLADSNYELRIAISFLKEVEALFKSRFSESERRHAIAYKLNESFQPALKAKVQEYSEKRNVDKISQLKQKMSELEEQAMKNLDKIIERGEKIDIMVERTKVMSETSYDLRTQATSVRRTMWWRNKKMCLLLVLLVLFVIFVIVLIACGGFSFSKCRSSKYLLP
jgi:vesicle-associated membrane protein 7